jgi:hypothetical protein
MVIAPASLLESGQQIEGTLFKIQPKLMLTPFTMDAREYLNSQYPKLPKKVENTISKLHDSIAHCEVCGKKTSAKSSALKSMIQNSVDWSEATTEAVRLVICCEKCYTVSNLREFLDIYLEESFVKTCGSQRLSGLIEHYLKVNGYKLSDIDVFNATIGLVVSLRTCVSRMNLSQKHPATRPNLESFIASLRSSQ